MTQHDDAGAFTIFAFKYRDRLTGKWVRARYKAEKHEIAGRHGEWEIIGPGETHRAAGAPFTPWTAPLVAVRPRPLGQRDVVLGPHHKPPGIDASERRLVGVFLRRLIVYEARKGRFDQVRNATDLLVEVASVAR